MENLSLKEFDILGIITLTDVSGIEEYVTPINSNSGNKEYLSRSKEYYPDLMGAMVRAFESTEKIGLCLRDKVKNIIGENNQEYCLLEEYKNTPQRISNPNSQKLVNVLEGAIRGLCMENEMSQGIDSHTEK